MESILTRYGPTEMLSEWLYLLRVTCVFKEVTLPQSFIVWILLESQGKGSIFCLCFSFFCLCSLRKFSGIAVKGLLQELEGLGCCRASVPVHCKAEQISCVTSRIALCGFLQ